MTRDTGRQIKNVTIFILSVTLLTALMILGPYYLESCLQNSQTIEASREVTIVPLSNSPISLNSEYFEWKVSINNLGIGNLNDLTATTPFYSLSTPAYRFNAEDKILIDSLTQADAVTK